MTCSPSGNVASPALCHGASSRLKDLYDARGPSTVAFAAGRLRAAGGGLRAPVQRGPALQPQPAQMGWIYLLRAAGGCSRGYSARHAAGLVVESARAGERDRLSAHSTPYLALSRNDPSGCRGPIMLPNTLITGLGLLLVYVAVLQPGLGARSPWIHVADDAAVLLAAIWARRTDRVRWMSAVNAALGIALLILG